MNKQTPTKKDLQFLKEMSVLRTIKKRGKEEALRLYPECALFINKQQEVKLSEPKSE